MARREWAEKRVDQLIRLDMSFADETDVVWLLKLEHARAVRIVKAEINAVKKDRHTYRSEERCLILGSLETVLNALQRGRGGKG